MSTSLEVAIHYTPPGSGLDLTLAVVSDKTLLVTVLRRAIADAEEAAKRAQDLLARQGYQTQGAFLRKYLDEMIGEWVDAMTRNVAALPRAVAALPKEQAAPELIQ